ncbi:WD40 repeat-like protein [Pilatotrama ljubarskyi]|nr:WD40 repeat-like protein [Pilatotrama ljubarskyi]
MVLRYEEYARLKRGLKGGVSAVAFSARGTFIAAGGTFDPTVYIWRVADRKLIQTYRGSSPFLSLAWNQEREDRLLCGSQGGYIDRLELAPTFSVAGFRAHDRPVECLALNGPWLASGAQLTIVIWEEVRAGDFRRVIELPMPPRSSQNEGCEVLVTGVHWTKSPRHSTLLLVSYMFHGIVIFNTGDWSRVRTIPTQGMV